MRVPLLIAAAIAAASCSGDPSTAGPTDALAAGWTARIDLSKPAEAGRFQLVADNLEVTPGENATLWHPHLAPSGSFRLEATVTHLDSGLHPHGAGLVFGGVDIDGANQSYTYFLVHGEGEFLIKTRNGAESIDIAPWTKHAAVAVEDKKLVTHNRLAVEVTGDEVRFLANGTVVHRTAAATVPTAGRCGFRLVHDLHVRFGPLLLTAIGQ